MRVTPIRTPRIVPHDDIAAILTGLQTFRDGDILCVSSKAVATANNEALFLADLTISERALTLAGDRVSDASFIQAVLDETRRMRGDVLDCIHGVLLTSLRPEGMRRGTLIAPNAGLDRSNIREGMAIGWPRDPARAARAIRDAVMATHGARIAVIITDSCCHPSRLGVTALALAASGMDPVRSLLGEPDLFGRTMRVTHEAVADQLATAANAVMGNDAQSTPAAVIADHGIPLSDYDGWVDGIEPDEDLFRLLYSGKWKTDSGQ